MMILGHVLKVYTQRSNALVLVLPYILGQDCVKAPLVHFLRVVSVLLLRRLKASPLRARSWCTLVSPWRTMW